MQPIDNILGLELTKGDLEQMLAFQERIGAPNLSTAIAQAMHWITEFRDLQDDGAVLCVVRDGKVSGLATLRYIPPTEEPSGQTQ